MATPLPPELLSSQEWCTWLDDRAAERDVPGLQVGVMTLGRNGSADVRVAARGVTSLATGVEVTPDTIFQIGSITKVWTATLIMQLVDEGRLDLDGRVVDILPDFTLADRESARGITVRHLLTHTSGIDGDIFADTGANDDCLARYVEQLAGAISITRPGGHLSYCNAGFVIAGRIVEVLRGSSWDDALAAQLLEPLGLRHTITRVGDAPLFRTAVGHLRIGAGSTTVRPASIWSLPRAIGPAGLICTSIGDLLRFATTQLRDGLSPAAPDRPGERVLSAASARTMRHRQVDLAAASTVQPGWGLGWGQWHWGSETSVGHQGGTIGQVSDLQLFPDRGLAVAVLTNSHNGRGLINDIHRRLGRELGLTPPTPRRQDRARTQDIQHLIGVWESTLTRWTIRPDGDGLVLDEVNKLPFDSEPDPGPVPLAAVGPGRFVIEQDGAPLEVAHVSEGGRDHLYMGRLLERTAASP